MESWESWQKVLRRWWGRLSKNIRIKDDLTPIEQRREKELWAEAKQLSDADANFVYLVKGKPPSRKIHRFKRDPTRGNQNQNREQAQANQLAATGLSPNAPQHQPTVANLGSGSSGLGLPRSV